MTALLIFGVFFIWIIALKTVATCDHRFIPIVSGVILAICMTAIIHFGGAPVTTTLLYSGAFFIVAFPALWILQKSDGIIIYLCIAVLATFVLFFGVPNFVDWMVGVPVGTEEMNGG